MEEDDPYEDIEPIPISAGGIVSPEFALGRDWQIRTLLQLAVPGEKGALLLGDRRIGKTTLFNAIEGPLRDAGHQVVRISAETDQLETFGRALTDALRMPKPKWAFEVAADAEVNVGAGKISLGGKANRQVPDAGTDIFSLCVRGVDPDSPYLVIFLIDEITVLATHLARRDQDEALEFLRTLRRARQSSDRIVMYFAGSIGLHHAALDDTEVNDLVKQHVDVLEAPDALRLAKGLLASVRLRVTDLDRVANEMVGLTDGFPYYVQSLAQYLSTQRRRLEPVSAAEVRTAFFEALPTWNIEHYDVRITQYYGEDDADVVREILDHIAATNTPVTVDELLVLPGVAQAGVSRTKMLNLLRRLEMDHYLRRAGNATTMANDLIRRFWLYIRRM